MLDGENSYDLFFLAMAHWRRGDKDKGRECFERACLWMDKNKPLDAELLRFRAEAPALLKLDTDKLVRLRDEGWLGMMYAHMISLLLWPKILNRALNIAAAEAAAADQVPVGRR